jgi:hypothetical protein
MEKPPLLSRGGKNSRRQNRREIQNYEALPRIPPSDAGNLKITLEKQKASPFGSAQVQFPAGNGESSAFFGGVNFFLPGTWQGFSIFHSLNFFTASGGRRGIFGLFKRLHCYEKVKSLIAPKAAGAGLKPAPTLLPLEAGRDFWKGLFKGPKSCKSTRL